jgi:N-glycosylase/DNA lyase
MSSPSSARGGEQGTPQKAKRRRRYSPSAAGGVAVEVTPEKAVSQPAVGVVTPTLQADSAVPTTIRAAIKLEFSNVSTVNSEFQDLCVPPAELRPSATLITGQCFHWRVVTTSPTTDDEGIDQNDQTKKSAWGSHDATEWIGFLRVPVTGETIVVVLKETPETVWYRTLHAPALFDVRSFLYTYFQLPDRESETSTSGSTEQQQQDRPLLKNLYDEWSTQCTRLQRIAVCLPGVRIVDQDPWECLISFLCSSNNNIPRITKMLNAIRREYGDPLVPLSCLGPDKRMEGEQNDNDERIIYSFPSLEKLKRLATESDLRNKCGMGYRAKYLMETMKILESLGGEAYLQELRLIDDPVVVQEKLTQFLGVGRKVADCVALFSLQQSDAIPVDVHVWDIARRDYGADSLSQTTKSLTPTIYKQIGELFRTRFPTRSGWAHSLLFVAELPSFREALPDDLVAEMDQFRLDAKAKKAAAKKK